ncbi:MAG: hypothetical protein JSS32_02255 [Verrucomicrobia bacterium]|nr:hypothetical protein [Verrucomicrobiota bacterium]
MKKWALMGVLAWSVLGADVNLRDGPWLTGPLIAPIGTAVPYGDFVVQSYVYFTANTGAYNRHWDSVSVEDNFYSLNLKFLCFFGITPWCDLNVVPQVLYNRVSNEHSLQVGDLTVGLDFQLMEPDLTPYFPGIKFAVREIFPVGNYRFLRARKMGADLSGAGTFATQFDLVFYKEFHLYDVHWLSLTASGQYTVNTPVNVYGFNAYGGGFGTKGVVNPGNSLQGVVSFEYTLSKNWALALDNIYTYTDGSQFFGTPGITFGGVYATTGKPCAVQFSFAPAIEYNFDSHLGIIAGCWFTAAGKNSAHFQSGVVNVEYTY